MDQQHTLSLDDHFSYLLWSFRDFSETDPFLDARRNQSDVTNSNFKQRLRIGIGVKFFVESFNSKLESDLWEAADNLRANSKLPSSDDFILAIVEFLDGDSHHVHYLRQPFHREPDFGVTSVNYNFGELLSRAEKPA